MKGIIAWVLTFWVVSFVLSVVFIRDGMSTTAIVLGWAAIVVISWALGNVAERAVNRGSRR